MVDVANVYDERAPHDEGSIRHLVIVAYRLSNSNSRFNFSSHTSSFNSSTSC